MLPTINRVHIEHPLHKTELHANCDLIANDIMGRLSFLNSSLRAPQGYMKYLFDEDYYIAIYKLMSKNTGYDYC